jgi:predicted thioesterase
MGIDMKLDSRLELSYTLKSTDLAKAISDDPQDDFPEVFATARMVALMELAAARLLRPLLSNDELSVGVHVNVTHMAATPNGEQVKAVAIYKGMEGNLHAFEVELHDRGGKAGVGTHTRAIVKTERLVEGAINRVSSIK